MLSTNDLPGGTETRPLIGRDRELAYGARLLAETAVGRSALLLIAGEAGVGKSALVQALCDAAQRMDYAVLAGICQEQDRDYPFAPFIDALQQQWHEPGADAMRALLTEQRDVFAQLLPVLGHVDGAAVSPLSPEQEKRRIFEAFVSLLARLCAEQPLLILLEDIHWADATSLELLHLLPRRLAHVPVLMVATARTDEPGSGLDHWLAGLQRHHLMTRLDLAPLAEADVARMIATIVHAPVSASFVAAINDRAEGNPFFVEELVHTMMDRGNNRARHPANVRSGPEAGVPSSVTETIGRRLDSLDAATRRVAGVAATIGRRFPFDLLAAITGCSYDDLIETLRTLIAHYLVIEEPVVGTPIFAFRHALTRDAISQRLLGPERRALHRAVAHALVTTTGERPVASADELGYHYYAAEEWAQAAEYAGRAGDAARTVSANAEALSQYRRALDAARKSGLSGDGPVMTLLHKCGTVLAILGDSNGAREAFEDALTRARAAGDTAAERQILGDLAGYYASSNYETARRFGLASLELARTARDEREQAVALNRLANITVNQAHFAEGLALHAQARAIFERAGDQWGIADSLDGIGMAHWLAGDMPEARVCFDQALAGFRALEDRERIASCLTSGALYLGVLDGACPYDANPDDCLTNAREAVALCQAISWTAGEIYARVTCAMAHIGRGTYAEALGELDVSLEMATQIGHQQWTIITLFTRAMALVEVRDIAGAEAVLEPASRIAEAMGGVQWAPRVAVWRLRCQFLLGERDGLDAALRPFLPVDERPSSLAERRALLLLGEQEMERGHPERVIEITQRLALPRDPTLPPRHSPATLLLSAEALAALGRGGEAREALEEARAIASSYGPRGLVWRISAALAAQGLPAGQQDVVELARAREELHALIDLIGDDGLRASLLQTAEARAVMAVSAPPRSPNGLTEREMGVLRLIAAGMSNREIATDLSVSVRTVERHIENLYRKIDARSKAEATAYAFRHDLT